MRSRLTLHEELCTILGTRDVYFQPPESIKMHYPCIVYERYNISNVHADDIQYLDPCQYRITVIDANPDSLIVPKIASMKTAKHIRHQIVENLNHDIFNIYY